MPNITGERDLLAGNALMFSSRFLLMSLGAALGGWTAANVGYQAAFIVNAISFSASAYSVWLIPDRRNQKASEQPLRRQQKSERVTGLTFAKVGLTFQPWAGRGDSRHQHPLGQRRRSDESDLRSVGRNCVCRRSRNQWRRGGCHSLLRCGRRSVYGHDDRAATGNLPGVCRAERFHWLGADHSGYHLRVHRRDAVTVAGVFASARVADAAGSGVCDSGNAADATGAGQLRGRVSTTDRASEFLIWSFSTAVAGWSLRAITPRTLTIIAGSAFGNFGSLVVGLFALRLVRVPQAVQCPKSNVLRSLAPVQSPKSNVQSLKNSLTNVRQTLDLGLWTLELLRLGVGA